MTKAITIKSHAVPPSGKNQLQVMEEISDSTWEKWKRKRKHTYVAFCLLGIIEGVDNSVILSTVFLYLKTSVPTSNPSAYYGVIIASFYACSIVFGLCFGRWLDRTRRVRVFTNMTLVIEMVGFLLYSIPCHPAFLLVGRCLCGVSEPFISVVSGEVVRIYGSKDAASALMRLSSMFYIGFTIGPGLNFLFKGVSFKLFFFQVNYLNFVGLFMAGLLLIILIVVNFLIHDCSKEIDLKELMSKNPRYFAAQENESCETDNLISEISDVEIPNKDENKDMNPIETILKRLFTTPDTIVIMFSALLNMFLYWSCATIFPVVMVTVHHWNAVAISNAYFITGVFNIVVFVVIAKYFKSNLSIYVITILGLLSLIIMWTALVCLNYIQTSLASEYILVIIFSIAYSLGFLEFFMLRIILSKMVPSRNQSFAESVRAGVAKSSTLTAISLSAIVLAKNLQWFSIPLMSGAVGLLVCYIVRSKSLQDPQELTF